MFINLFMLLYMFMMFLSHPLMYLILLIMLSLTVSFFMSFYMKISILSMIFFLFTLSGVLILFLYMVSISNSEMLYIKNFKAIFFVLVMIYLINIILSNYNDLIMKVTNLDDIFFNFFYSMNFFLMILMMNYILMSLILIIENLLYLKSTIKF